MKFDIYFDREHREDARVLLDGEDITKHVLAEGFGIELNTAGHPVVALRLKPDSVAVNGDLYVTEAPPVEVCKCGHTEALHARPHAGQCAITGCTECNGWEPTP